MIFIKIKYKLNLFFRAILFKIGFEKKILKNRYGERILLFHGIDKEGKTKYNSRFISDHYFDDLIVYIKTHFNVISLEEYDAKKFKKDTLNIAITFDDGYLNNYKYALPILKKHNIPASFFCTSNAEKENFLWPDFLDLVTHHTSKKNIIFENNNYKKNRKGVFTFQNKTLKNRCKELDYDSIKPLFKIFKKEWDYIKNIDLDDYWQLMKPEHLKKFYNDSLFTIGAHGHTHSNLTKLPFEEAKNEILKSKNNIESYCKKSIDSFAFPFGYYNLELVNYCKSLGVEKIMLIDYLNKNDANSPSLKNRFVVNPYISKKQLLASLLKGSYI